MENVAINLNIMNEFCKVLSSQQKTDFKSLDFSINPKNPNVSSELHQKINDFADNLDPDQLVDFYRLLNKESASCSVGTCCSDCICTV